MKRLEASVPAPDLHLPDRSEDVRSLVVRISKVSIDEAVTMNHCFLVSERTEPSIRDHSLGSTARSEPDQKTQSTNCCWAGRPERWSGEPGQGEVESQADEHGDQQTMYRGVAAGGPQHQVLWCGVERSFWSMDQHCLHHSHCPRDHRLQASVLITITQCWIITLQEYWHYPAECCVFLAVKTRVWDITAHRGCTLRYSIWEVVKYSPLVSGRLTEEQRRLQYLQQQQFLSVPRQKSKSRSRKSSRDSQASSSSSRRCSPSPTPTTPVLRSRSMKERHNKERRTGYKKSKTADLNHKIEACNMPQILTTRSGSQVDLDHWVSSENIIVGWWTWYWWDNIQTESWSNVRWHQTQRWGQKKVVVYWTYLQSFEEHSMSECCH